MVIMMCRDHWVTNAKMTSYFDTVIEKVLKNMSLGVQKRIIRGMILFE